jgi:polysaccharide export outer membrane protein
MRAVLTRKVFAATSRLAFVTLSFLLGNAGAADAAPAPEAIAPAPGADYIIGPRDTLRVFVLRSPELTAEVPVRPDGKISTPLVNDMQAVGKTASQLAHDIEAVLAEFVRSPTVSVIVTNALGVQGQVRVVGQAVNPRSLPYRSGMTVLDVVIEVGGLSQYAAGNRAKLMRKQGKGTKEIRLKLKDLLEDGDMSQNIAIERDDVIVIPESRF